MKKQIYPHKPELPLLNISWDSIGNFSEAQNLGKYIKQLYFDKTKLIDDLFWQKIPVATLLNQRSNALDEVLIIGWNFFELYRYDNICLIAVGGYGNARIHPGSDADILILIDSKDDILLNQRLEKFIAYIWDVGIKLGQSVRTSKECLELAKSDVTIYTNLLSARLILGQLTAFDYLVVKLTDPQHSPWSFEDFLKAKLDERKKRHKQYANTSYTLEPSIKDSPGGLRDVDLIKWLNISCYSNLEFKSLINEKVIEQEEVKALEHGEQYLWYIRYGLHLVNDSASDRLYFEHQELLAKKLNFEGETTNQAVTSFMQAYFCTTNLLKDITDVICQHFLEKLFAKTHIENPVPLNSYSEVLNNFVRITEISFLKKHPEALISLFLTIAKKNLSGFSAKTTRMTWHLIQDLNSQQLNNVAANKNFLQILQSKTHAYTVLNQMWRMGLLAKYIPEFNNIVGQMQYDLYHIYTVDAHTLLVLKNIQNFFKGKFPEFAEPLSSCIEAVQHPEVLFLAGLLHDIGKGQNKNHSIEGQKIAEDISNKLNLAEKLSNDVSWLVRCHLELSEIAQTKDITDLNVIENFAKRVQSEQRLGYLYILTVADILATNAKLWNSWRATLLKCLFEATKKYLQKQLHADFTFDHNIEQCKQHALNILNKKHGDLCLTKISQLWESFDLEYFKQTSPDNIAWHTVNILTKTQPTIGIRPHWNQVGTDIFFYTPDTQGMFAAICATLEKMFLTVLDARIMTSKDKQCINSFIVLESTGQPISGPQRLKEIRTALADLLISIKEQPKDTAKVPRVSRRVPRFYKYFQGKSQVKINSPENSQYTIVEIHAPDFPGLLARIGVVFVKSGISLHKAKINTLDNKVEDIFYITQKDGNTILSEKAINTLKIKLKKSIDSWPK